MELDFWRSALPAELVARTGRCAVQRLAIASTVLVLASCGGGGGGGGASSGAGGGGAVPATSEERQAAFDSARGALSAAPPSATTATPARIQALRDFDALLSKEGDSLVPNTPELIAHYRAAVQRVERELAEPVVSGFRVWALYNNGFIVKTPTVTLAFDLIRGRYTPDIAALNWNVAMPASILDRIDILFVSHEHGDHREDALLRDFKTRSGKTVIYPGDGAASPVTVLPMWGGRLIGLNGVNGAWGVTVLAHDLRDHNAVNLMYEVNTGEGISILHTGDSGDTNLYPRPNYTIDLLLQAGFVSYPSNNNLQGMRDAMNAVRPRFMVPGHFHEFNHHLPLSYAGPFRYAYDSAITLMGDTALPGQPVVLTWGESLSVPN